MCGKRWGLLFSAFFTAHLFSGHSPGFLKTYSSLAPSPLEAFEALEQLRVLWHGYRIVVAVSETAAPPGVDTPDDLEKVRKLGSVP